MARNLRNCLKKGMRQCKMWERQKYLKRKKSGLRNYDFTIISSNCNGAFIYRDLDIPYLTPTVNLTIEMKDFVKMVRELRWYMQQEIVKSEENYEYPVGLLGDIRINFLHYESFEAGVQKWEERKRRINWDNLFFFGTARGYCTYDTIRDFDQLPYANKVIFTNRQYPEFRSAHYIKGFDKQEEIGILVEYKKQLLLRRYLDDFDYVDFLNKNKMYNETIL